MRNKVLEELGYVIDEKTVTFFSIAISEENGKLVPTYTYMAKPMVANSGKDSRELLVKIMNKMCETLPEV